MSPTNTSWKTAKPQYFGPNAEFSSNDLPWKYHHSIENLILHITQAAFTVNTSLLANVSREYYLENPLELSVLDETFSFLSMTYPENTTIAIENLILHITEVVSELTQVY